MRFIKHFNIGFSSIQSNSLKNFVNEQSNLLPPPLEKLIG
jgi:hypothetical protein